MTDGMKSRKFWFSVGTCAIVAAGGALGAWKPAFAPLYPEFIAGVLGALTIYCGGNIAHHVVAGKFATTEDTTEESSHTPPKP